MSINKEKKRELISQFQKHKKDQGSIEVQCAILSERIANLTKYYKKYKKDIPPKRKLLQLAAIRKKFLKYLKKNNFDSYKNLLERLSLRPV